MNAHLLSWSFLLIVFCAITISCLAALGIFTLFRNDRHRSPRVLPALLLSMAVLPMMLTGLFFAVFNTHTVGISSPGVWGSRGFPSPNHYPFGGSGDLFINNSFGKIPPARVATIEKLKPTAEETTLKIPPVVPEPTVVTAPTQPTEVKELVYDADGTVQEKIRSEAIPDWISSRNEKFEGDQGVLLSQRFSSLEEARAQIEQEVRELFKNRDIWMPLPFMDQRSALSLLQMNGGILRECQITWPVEVGAFTEPVYQIALQVQLNRSVSERLMAATSGLRKTRNLRWLGSGVVMASLALALSSLFFKKLAQREL